MTTPLPALDERTRVAIADALFQALAETTKGRKILERTRDIAQAGALAARVRQLNGPKIDAEDAVARERAAVFVEWTIRQADERAARAEITELNVRALKA